MFGLPSLYAKLIMSGVVIMIVGALYFYVTNLQDDNKALHDQNVVLQDDNKELQEHIKQQTELNDVINQVNELGNELRNQNKTEYNSKNVIIDNKVNQGKDKPVGPLLKEFLNGE